MSALIAVFYSLLSPFLPEGNLLVMSYNIAMDRTVFGERIGENEWQNRVGPMGKLVTSYRPALLATQEGYEKQIKELEAVLPTLKLVEDHRIQYHRSFYPSLFYDPSQLELLESGDQWLSNTPNIPGTKLPEADYARMLSWAQFRDLTTGKKFVAVTTHLNADYPDDVVRVAQTKVLVELLWNLKEKGPLLLTGDFNDTPDSTTRNVLKDSHPELVDPWKALGLPEESSYNGFDHEHAESVGRIDWIMADDTAFDSHDAWIDKSFYARGEAGNRLYPSDHFLSCARLLIPILFRK